MDVLVGFGAPSATALWVATTALAVFWLVRQGRAGALVTVPSYVVAFWFVLPVLLQYPFTFSPANTLATGVAAYDAYTGEIDRALLVSVVGMAAFALAFAALPKEPRPSAFTLFVGRAFSALSHPGLLWASSLGVSALFVFLALTGLLGAEGMRNRAMEAPVLRPFFNAAAAILPLLIGAVLLAASERRRVLLWVLVAVLFLPAVLTGSRAIAFGGVMSYALTVLCYRSLRRELRTRRLIALLPIAAVVLFLVFYLADARVGQYNPFVTFAGLGYHLFYGNNFSDLRDFAWILAYWDGELLAGRTQLAGVMGFIPAILSPFRTSWSWGRVSLDIVGLGTREVDAAHPGLRPGMFGEPYLNFGLLGVAASGLLLGYFAVRLHAATRDAVDRYPPFEAKLMILAAFTVLQLVANLFITGGFFAVYVVLGVLVLVRVAKAILRAGTASPSFAER
jgi:oligosaccharide repeat unit polymerase